MIAEANQLEQDNPTIKIELDAETLSSLWSQFLEESKEIIHPSYYGTFCSITPRFVDNQNIEFKVSSSVIKGYLDNIRVDMNSFFKKNVIICPEISVRVEISEEDEKSKPRTPIERFNILLQKNPSIKTMVQKLDLDLDI